MSSAASGADPGPVPDSDEDDEDLSDAGPPQAEARREAEAAPAKPRSLDETVLAVLREEADREAAARRAKPTPTGDRKPDRNAAGAGSGSRRHGRRSAPDRQDARVAPEPSREAVPDPQPEPVHKSRSQMLPAIEEINSTLRATGERSQDEDDAIVDTLPI